MLLLGAERVSGIDLVAELTGLRVKAAQVDIVLTGEGAFDFQSRDGKVISGVMSSNTTSTGISQRTDFGSAATSTMCVSMRGPSSSSTMPITIGGSTGNLRGGR